jgi:hypothetical protein
MLLQWILFSQKQKLKTDRFNNSIVDHSSFSSSSSSSSLDQYISWYRYCIVTVVVSLHGVEKVVILTQGNSEQPTAEIANDEDNNASSSAFSLDVNNVFIAATVHPISPENVKP